MSGQPGPPRGRGYGRPFKPGDTTQQAAGGRAKAARMRALAAPDPQEVACLVAHYTQELGRDLDPFETGLVEHGAKIMKALRARGPDDPGWERMTNELRLLSHHMNGLRLRERGRLPRIPALGPLAEECEAHADYLARIAGDE